MLRTENLTKRYGDLQAVKGVTLDVFLGETLTAIGPSGCGKTTLLRLIAGLERPDEGRILIDGIEVSTPGKMVAPHERGLSMIFQDLALWPHMTVREHIEFIMKKDKLARDVLKSKATMILKDVNLSGYESRYPHELSGGEKQRLAIARALASKPIYLLMDEPFSNLDTILKEELRELVIGLKDSHRVGIIYVTHNIEEMSVLADKIAIMDKGELIQAGTKDDVLGNPRNGFVRRFLRI